jgi:uncharacterized protein YraI
MQRGLLIVFALMLLALAPLAQARPPQQAADLLAEIVVRTNLRAGGGVEWRIMGTYGPGTPIRLDGMAFDGTWVRGIVPDGTVGWVLSEYLNISREQAAGLRGIWVDEPFTLSAPGGGPAPAQAQNQAQAAPADTAPAVSSPAAAPVSASGGIATTTANGVNMRTEPNGALIRTLAFNEPVTVDGKHPDGGWVRVITADGARGWVVTSFVVLTGDQFAALPFVTGGAAAPAPAAAQPSANSAPIEIAPAAAVVNTASVSGFNLGGHVKSLNANTVQRMRQAGMTWVKYQWRYQRGQSPDSAGGLIDEAHANGFRILLGIVGLPNELNQPGYQNDYAAFVAGVAARGADAIEVWNEPNIDREWPAGSISPAAYTNLLRAAYGAIKAANPNTLVISGAPAPTGFFGGCSGAGCDDDAFVRGMAAAGAASAMDCLGIHYNEGILGPDATSGDPRGNSGHYTRYFWGMINTYTRAFGGSRPLCFTELGYLTPEGFPPLPGGFAWAENVTLAQQANWLARAVTLARNSGRVRLFIIWNVDFTDYGSDPMAGYAMIRPDGSCPACEALSR